MPRAAGSSLRDGAASLGDRLHWPRSVQRTLDHYGRPCRPHPQRRGSARDPTRPAMVPLTRSYTVPFYRGDTDVTGRCGGSGSCRELGHSAAAPYAPAIGASTRPGSMYRHENW